MSGLGASQLQKLMKSLASQLGFRHLRFRPEGAEAMHQILVTFIRLVVAKSNAVHLSRKPSIMTLTTEGRTIEEMDLEQAASILDLSHLLSGSTRSSW